MGTGPPAPVQAAPPGKARRQHGVSFPQIVGEQFHGAAHHAFRQPKVLVFPDEKGELRGHIATPLARWRAEALQEFTIHGMGDPDVKIAAEVLGHRVVVRMQHPGLGRVRNTIAPAQKFCHRKGVFAEHQPLLEITNSGEQIPAIGGKGIGDEGGLEAITDPVLERADDGAFRIVEHPQMPGETGGVGIGQLPPVGRRHPVIRQRREQLRQGLRISGHRILGQIHQQVADGRSGPQGPGPAMIKILRSNGDDPGPVLLREGQGFIAGAGIDDQDLVRQPALRAQGGQQLAEAGTAVAGRDNDRDEGLMHIHCSNYTFNSRTARYFNIAQSR